MRAAALFLAVLFLAGCNALEGLGKDIQVGGKKLEKAVSK